MHFLWILVMIAGLPPNSMNLAFMRLIVLCTDFLALPVNANTRCPIRLRQNPFDIQVRRSSSIIELQDNLDAINSNVDL